MPPQTWKDHGAGALLLSHAGCRGTVPEPPRWQSWVPRPPFGIAQSKPLHGAVAGSFREHRATGLAPRDKYPREEHLDPIISCMKHREPMLDPPASPNPCLQDSE